MILVRSPLRITLGGGGTDLPVYATQFGGFSLTASIDRYVYVAVMRPFEPGIYLKYSDSEMVSCVDEITHPIIRECLRALQVEPQIEITTLADIPAGTGLASSSSFTTALLAALALHRHDRLLPEELASMACEIEMHRLQQPIGSQDQYAAAFGGILAQTVCPTGRVSVERLRLSSDARMHLEDHLLLFFTGYARTSITDMLTEQGTHLGDLHEAKANAQRARAALLESDWPTFAATLASRRSKPIPPRVQQCLDYGESTGASGKLVGAGGGGFLLFYADDTAAVRQAMTESGLPEVRFGFDNEGTRSL